ncbi:unnamed protein product [Amoebophrya sp. A25]|nr:unnamed protein product [Amoebophrya sp. A25]|eukprot:GSA25T00018674001.1
MTRLRLRKRLVMAGCLASSGVATSSRHRGAHRTSHRVDDVQNEESLFGGDEEKHEEKQQHEEGGRSHDVHVQKKQHGNHGRTSGATRHRKSGSSGNHGHASSDEHAGKDRKAASDEFSSIEVGASFKKKGKSVRSRETARSSSALDEAKNSAGAGDNQRHQHISKEKVHRHNHRRPQHGDHQPDQITQMAEHGIAASTAEQRQHGNERGTHKSDAKPHERRKAQLRSERSRSSKTSGGEAAAIVRDDGHVAGSSSKIFLNFDDADAAAASAKSSASDAASSAGNAANQLSSLGKNATHPIKNIAADIDEWKLWFVDNLELFLTIVTGIIVCQFACLVYTAYSYLACIIGPTVSCACCLWGWIWDLFKRICKSCPCCGGGSKE